MGEIENRTIFRIRKRVRKAGACHILLNILYNSDASKTFFPFWGYHSNLGKLYSSSSSSSNLLMLIFYRYAEQSILCDKNGNIESKSCSTSQSNKLGAQPLLSLSPHIYSFTHNPIPSCKITYYILPFYIS